MTSKLLKSFILLFVFTVLICACTQNNQAEPTQPQIIKPTETALSLVLSEDPAALTKTPVVVTPTAVQTEKANCDLIAFVLSDQENSHICTVCPDGSDFRQLTEGSVQAIYPAWSPDGERIAYAATRRGEDPQIYLMDADGNNNSQLTDDLINDRPLWLPDGEKIVFRTTDGQGLWWWRILDLKNGEIKDYSIPSYDFFWQTPAFSPDGKQVAVMSLAEQEARNDGASQIHVLDLEVNSERAITWDTWANISPIWSPDGEQIAFLSERDGTYNSFALYIMDTHGENLKKLSDAVFSENSNLSWSSDGTRIAVDKFTMWDAEILLFDLEGNEPLPLLDLPSGQQAVMPSWAH